jgi:16S rRNA processing protein RimM
MKKIYIECGKILGAHGVKGIVKVDSWCDSPKVLSAQKRVFLACGEGYKETEVESASDAGDTVLMKLSCLCDREAAQAMKGIILYLHRDDIPRKKGALLLADIIGLPAKDIDTGRTLGIVKDITESVASSLYVIETEDGKEVLIPGIKEFIKEIKEDDGVYIHTIPGFFTEI